MTDTHLKVSVFSSYQRLTIVLSSKSSHYLSFKKYILLVLQVSYSVLLIQLIFPFSLLGIEIYIPVWDFVLSYVLALMESKNPSRICTNSCLSPFKSLVQSCICCATKRTPSGTISYIIYIYIYLSIPAHMLLCVHERPSPQASFISLVHAVVLAEEKNTSFPWKKQSEAIENTVTLFYIWQNI